MNLPSRVVLEETALGALLLIALCIFMAMSFVFTYHWNRFGIPTPLFRRMRRLYFAVSTVLVVLSILLFIFTLVSF